MYKAPSFGLGMKKDLRESIESVYDINNTINEEEQLIISLFEEFLKENFHVEMLTEEDIDYILENEFPQWLEENEEYLTEIFQLTPIVAGAARAALPALRKLGKYLNKKTQRNKERDDGEWSIKKLLGDVSKKPPPLPPYPASYRKPPPLPPYPASYRKPATSRTTPSPSTPKEIAKKIAKKIDKKASQKPDGNASKKEKLRKQMENQFRIYRESREDIEATPPLLESEQKNINEFIDINSIHKNVRDWLKGWKKGENNPPPKQQGRLLRTPQSKENEDLKAAERFIDGITPQPKTNPVSTLRVTPEGELVPPLSQRKPRQTPEMRKAEELYSGLQSLGEPRINPTLLNPPPQTRRFASRGVRRFAQQGARPGAQQGAGPDAQQGARPGAQQGAGRFSSPSIGATKKQERAQEVDSLRQRADEIAKWKADVKAAAKAAKKRRAAKAAKAAARREAARRAESTAGRGSGAPKGSWTARREGLGYRSNLKAAKSQAYRKAYSAYKARKSPKKWSDSVFDPKD